MSHEHSLPDSWIIRIFDQMSALYGKKFADQWSGTDPVVMRRVWAQKLGGFHDQPKAIKQALDAMDAKPFPPTLPEFLTMCREAGSRGLDRPPLLEHVPSAEEIERATKAREEAVKAAHVENKRDPLKWAKDLKERHDNGEKLAYLQVKMYREAMGIKDAA